MSRRCPIHHGLLERSRFDGTKYSRPVCWSCLPDHRKGCPMLDHLALAAVFYGANIARSPAFYDLRDGQRLSDAAFLAEFGPAAVPPCHCPARLQALGVRDEKPTLPQTKVCHICSMNGPKVENWTWRECRVALAPMLAKTLPAGLERMQTVPVNFVIALHPWCLKSAVKARAEVTSLSVHP